MKPPAEFKVMRIRDCATPADLVDTPDRVFTYWQANIATAPWFDPAKEAFVVLILNTRRRILGHNLVALGGLDSVAVHPREVFRPVIVAAGSALILAHNHPSMDPSPSEADIRVTRDLVGAGKLLRIDILDHVIIGRTFSSLRSQGVRLRRSPPMGILGWSPPAPVPQRTAGLSGGRERGKWRL